ncbi:HlyD family secretion protein [Amniculibacterium aquaticum]|uniref:HlyD family secretion protein n=1 Tax=Amniculibacterium aquaticum TaxID=2479858 RepID=UPI000F5A6E89|nr:HlyD family efflux transporter periplasmic adaptor subunit [Amniculibacterium aquaticum]
METNRDILDNIQLRSEEVQDILSQPPHWLIRWGNTILLAILVMVIMMSWFIKYPEFVPAPIIITTENAPEKLLAKTTAKIEKIYIANQQMVDKNQIMMVLQSSANYQDVLLLKNILDDMQTGNVANFPLNKTSHLKLGELQMDYNVFAKALQEEKSFQKLQPYSPEQLAISQNEAETKTRMATLQQQLGLEQTKFQLSKKNYDRSQHLFEQGVLSALEMENEKIKILQEEQNVRNLQLSVSQTQETISNLYKNKSNTHNTLQKDVLNYQLQSTQSLEQLRKSLKQWELNYLITSSTKGKVSYQQMWGENQMVKSGDAIFTILPSENQRLVGRMFVPATNAGKIVNGEKVLIKLNNFRYQEYGIVQGTVQNMALSPDEKGNYFVEVILPKGLHTSYNKTLTFDKELSGNAEIVTQDLRLLQRLFYQFRKLLGYQA